MTGQTVLDGMPTRLFSCTPTRLTTWLDCPRRYRFVYVDRPTPPKGPAWAHTSVGASAHNALRAWWDVDNLPRRTPATAAALVRDGWLVDGFRDEDQSHEWRERTAEMVAAYVESLDPIVEPRGLERTVAVRTDRLALSGRVDRVDERVSDDGEPEMVVVDYKTSRRPSTSDEARGSLALAVYVLAVRRTLRARCTRVELHHLPTGQVAAWEHNDESLGRHLRRAESIAQEASAAEQAARDDGDLDELFPPRPSSMCGWCDFARHCPEGREAGPMQEPWAALRP